MLGFSVGISAVSAKNGSLAQSLYKMKLVTINMPTKRGKKEVMCRQTCQIFKGLGLYQKLYQFVSKKRVFSKYPFLHVFFKKIWYSR